MDPKLEHRLAAIIMARARRLKEQAEEEGVSAYLHPKIRARPNPRFLSATVQGVEQANRMADMNEMWSQRTKELHQSPPMTARWSKSELASKPRDQSVRASSPPDIETPVAGARLQAQRSALREGDGARPPGVQPRPPRRPRSGENLGASGGPPMAAAAAQEVGAEPPLGTIPREHGEENGAPPGGGPPGGLADAELEAFLAARAKRGRGTVGPRMDEPGPFLPRPAAAAAAAPCGSDVREKEEWESRILGPHLPDFSCFPTTRVPQGGCSEEEKEGDRSPKRRRHKKRNWAREEGVEEEGQGRPSRSGGSGKGKRAQEGERGSRGGGGKERSKQKRRRE